MSICHGHNDEPNEKIAFPVVRPAVSGIAVSIACIIQALRRESVYHTDRRKLSWAKFAGVVKLSHS